MSLKKFVHAFIGMALIPMVLSCTKASTEKKALVIGFNPAENAEVMDASGKQFGEYIKSKMGLEVSTFVATDYTALIEALRSGRVDIAFLPPFSFVKAESIAGAQVLLKSVRRGSPFYYAAVITRVDKNINKIEDLKGKNMAWVDPSSAGGHIIPKAQLMQKFGIDPDTFFNKQIFAGSHDALVLSVVNGTVDAGATFANDAEGTDGAWTQFLKGDDAKKVKAIFVTDPIAADTMATSKKFMDANGELVKKLVDTISTMDKDEQGKKILKELYRVDGMMAAKAEDYDSIRAAAKLLKVDQ